MSANKIAIIVFSRFAEQEANHKKYAHSLGRKNGVVLATQLIKHTLKEAHATQLPVYTFFPDKQQGSDFGQKLSHCIETVYSYGFSSVIVIGTDCPSITSEVIINASDKLHEQHLVLGPATDGGVYLIGIRRDAYCRKSFLSVPWLSGHVYGSLIDYSKRLELMVSIQALQDDIDHYSTLIDWTERNVHHTISYFFNLLASSCTAEERTINSFAYLQQFYFSKHCFRGPPSLFCLFH